jgi:hypothetical protein
MELDSPDGKSRESRFSLNYWQKFKCKYKKIVCYSYFEDR